MLIFLNKNMAKTKIAINGFGRIGRVFFRNAFGHPNLEFVAVNDLGSPENMAYLLKYDTVYGPYEKSVKTKNGNFVVDGKEIKIFPPGFKILCNSTRVSLGFGTCSKTW